MVVEVDAGARDDVERRSRHLGADAVATDDGHAMASRSVTHSLSLFFPFWSLDPGEEQTREGFRGPTVELGLLTS